MTPPPLTIPRRAIYLPIVAAAYVLSEFSASNVALEALGRPLVVVVVAAIVVQIALSVILMSSDRGAFIGLILFFLLMGLPAVSLVLTAWLTISAVVALRRPRRLRAMPWLRATRILNGVAGLTLLLVVADATVGGAFTFGSTGWDDPRGTAASGAPDVYLIMLDGYPRADTLATDFDFDNRPFLSTMEGLGFEVATDSHSNYDATVLTLASVMNGAQVPALVPDPPKDFTAQFRAVARLINDGNRLRDFHAAGYEVVTVPSGYYEGALTVADRFLDSGELSTFEMQLLTRGGMPSLLGGIERTWLPDQHRSRVRNAFATLGNLAAERTGTPKLVFAHLLTPHMPIAFSKDGSPAAPLPCFPMTCSLFDYGDEYGVASGGPMLDQIAYINAQVEATVRTIQARSERPAVIVIFSDHGLRNDPTDRDEMFRSLFLAATPGRDGVFPTDMSPVNVLTDLLNAYAGTDLARSSDEAYWLDTRAVDTVGLFEGGSMTKTKVVSAR